MGKGGGSAPAAPDYASLLTQQAGINQAAFNTQLGAGRTNAVNPYGSTVWTPPPGFYTGANRTGGTATTGTTPTTATAASTSGVPDYLAGLLGLGSGAGTNSIATPTAAPGSTGGINGASTNAGPWTQSTGFSAPMQNVVNPALKNAAGAAASFDASKNPTFDPAAVGSAFYNKEMGLLEPTMQAQRTGLQNQLAAQGFDSTGGSQGGATTALNNLDNQQNLLRSNAASSAIAQEIPQGAQALSAQQSTQLLPGQEAATWLNTGIAPASTLPGGAAQTPSLSPVDAMGAAQQNYANQMSGYNAQQAAAQNQMNGLFSLAGTAGMFMGI